MKPHQTLSLAKKRIILLNDFSLGTNQVIASPTSSGDQVC